MWVGQWGWMFQVVWEALASRRFHVRLVWFSRVRVVGSVARRWIVVVVSHMARAVRAVWLPQWSVVSQVCRPLVWASRCGQAGSSSLRVRSMQCRQGPSGVIQGPMVMVQPSRVTGRWGMLALFQWWASM